MPNASAVVVAIALVGAGCGGSPDGNGIVVTPCDLAAQTGCSAGNKCTLLCDLPVTAIGCAPEDGALGPGEACSSTAPCRGGSFCAASAPSAPALQCVQFCSDDVPCVTGTCTSRMVSMCGEPVTTRVCQ
jgi:hypothetical protein